jgi:hypothetical protein
VDKVIAAALVAAALSGCAAFPLRTGSLCTAGPVILDSQDHLTRSTAEQIVTLNESGEKVCGWRSPKH